MSAELRVRIRKELRRNGLVARPDAAKWIETAALADAEPLSAVKVIICEIKAAGANSVVEVRDVERAIHELTKDPAEANGHEGVKVLADAFAMPKWAYNAARNQFYQTNHSSKHAVWRDRYVLVRQRIMRNKSFAPPLIGVESLSRTGRRVHGGSSHIELTQIESLVASEGTQCVLGIISRLSDGKLYLEDLNGKVPIILSENCVHTGFVCEGCLVLAEGRLVDGSFMINDLHLPPGEAREKTLTAHGRMDFLEGKNPLTKEKFDITLAEEKGSADATFIFLSDVHLDNEKSLLDLDRVLEGFSQIDPPPKAFVFMGNFTEQPFGQGEGQCSTVKFRGLFTKLADIMLEYPNLLEKSDFVFVPGPRDPGTANLFPQARLPNFLVKEMQERVFSHFPEARLHFSTNPCRIGFHTQEIVIFREDLVSKVRRLALQEPEELSLSIADHLAETLISQSHLCPLSLSARPILWSHDNSLRLYPLPSLLVLGDRHDQFKATHNTGSHVVNPGSFSLDSSFIVYYPASGESQFSRVQPLEPAMELDGEYQSSSEGEDV